MFISSGLFLVLSIVSSAAIAIVLKWFQSDGGNRYAILLGNYLTCVIIGIGMLPNKGDIVKGEGITLLCGLIGGILFVGGLVLTQRSIEINGAILSSAVGKLGLIVPLLLSILFFGERPRVMQIVGLAIVLVAMWVITGKKDVASDFSPLLLIAVLVVTGFADGMVKVFEHVGKREQDEIYILYVFIVATFLTMILLIMESRRTGNFGMKKDFLAGIAVGIPNYFASALLLRALAKIPAFIAYAMFSTGTILLVTLVSVVFFKERPTKYQGIGLALILIAIFFLNK